MTETEQDAENEKWFITGWNAALRDVLAVAKHQGDEAAVDWASRHPAGPRAEEAVTESEADA